MENFVAGLVLKDRFGQRKGHRTPGYTVAITQLLQTSTLPKTENWKGLNWKGLNPFCGF